MISITKTTDYNAIREIAGQTWPKTYGHILSPEQIEYMFAMMYDVDALKNQATSKKHHFILAEENGIPLGFASYELNYQEEPKTKIHKIYILPETQGKGIGKKLLDFISGKAIESQNNILSLNVNRHNTAYQFYTKIGFEKRGEEDIDVGNGYLMEDYIMEKDLAI